MFPFQGANLSGLLLEQPSTVLNELIEEQDLDAINWAVENGACLGIQPGGIPLLNAICVQDYEITKFLLSFGADPNLFTEAEEVCYPASFLLVKKGKRSLTFLVR